MFDMAMDFPIMRRKIGTKRYQWLDQESEALASDFGSKRFTKKLPTSRVAVPADRKLIYVASFWDRYII